MKNIFLTIGLLVTAFSFANGPESVKSPEQIQRELNQAQSDFETAQKMFIPWYTGPLITGSANNVPVGRVNIQGYLFLENQYASFTGNRKSVSIDDIYTVNPLFLVQYGITKWLDFTATGQGFFRWQNSQNAQHFGDTTVNFGLQILTQKPYSPSIRFVIGENFPSGKYEHLSANKNGIDSTGAGAYSTNIGLNFNQIFWGSLLHPVSVRFSSSYTIPNHKVDVEGFNSYGGGYGTNGKVDVGQTLNLDLGIEVSLTQKWVFATDIAYFYSNSSSFSGTPGTTSTGAVASNGAPSADQLSLAPAIEYNPNENGGFIGGIWFPVTGRNSSNFISLVLSYTYLF